MTLQAAKQPVNRESIEMRFNAFGDRYPKFMQMMRLWIVDLLFGGFCRIFFVRCSCLKSGGRD